MLATILSVLGGGGLGAILRYIPTILDLFKSKQDKAHELALLDKQRELALAQAKTAADAQAAAARFRELAEEMAAYREAIASQSKLTGVRWADALSASVRPVTTYWWMTLYTLIKVVIVIVAAIEAYLYVKAARFAVESLLPALQGFVDKAWTPQDAAILSMILGFWFVDRSLRKRGM